MNWKADFRRQLGAISREMMFLHGYLPVTATEPAELRRAVATRAQGAPARRPQPQSQPRMAERPHACSGLGCCVAAQRSSQTRSAALTSPGFSSGARCPQPGSSTSVDCGTRACISRLITGGVIASLAPLRINNGSR